MMNWKYAACDINNILYYPYIIPKFQKLINVHKNFIATFYVKLQDLSKINHRNNNNKNQT